MAMNPERLLNHAFGEIVHSYSERDVILYALGLGLGHDPVDRDDLIFLLEARLAVVPTFAVTLASPGAWIAAPEFGVNFVKLVHAEQAAWFHAPLPAAAEIVGRARVLSLSDRGPERGAVLVLQRDVHDARNGTHYCTLHQTLLMRGDGGFGGPPVANTSVERPERSPDHTVHVPVSLRAALIYRLSGDRNPLHADPDIAAKAGFARPILHGLASYGMAGVAVARACGHPVTQVAALQCRFSSVIFPGDVIDFSIWQSGESAVFQAFVGERKVLDQGVVSFRSAA